MRRRDFIALVGGTAAWTIAARAQQVDRKWIGVQIGPAATDAEPQRWIAAFVRKLGEAGWIEGRNLRIDYRFGEGNSERMRAQAVELVGRGPDLILADGTPVVSALKQLTHTLPIVFVNVSDPLKANLVANLARPGGNMTGFSGAEYSTAGKWLELLKQVVPGIARALVIYDPELASVNAARLRLLEAVAPSLDVRLTTISVRDQVEIEHSINAFVTREPNGGMIVMSSPMMVAHRERIIAMAATHRLPAIYGLRYYATSGGLMSYGADVVDQYRNAASYVDRILRGEKPGELPVQQPIRYELVINLKTAKALGLEVPPKLLALADEVIE